MPLVDARGNPTSPPKTLTDEQLFQILTALRMRIEGLQQQQLEQGLFTEYLTELLLAKEVEGEAFITLDEDDYSTFVKARMAQIQEQFAEQQKAAHLAKAEADLETGIKLDE